MHAELDLAVRDEHDYMAKVARVRALAEQIETVVDAKAGADLSASYRVWAERAGLGQEKVNLATIAQIECECRAGELLARLPKQPGRKNSRNVTANSLTQRQSALMEVGASKDIGDRWLEMGAVPVERRERILSACEGERLSVSYFLKQAKTDGLYSSDRGDWATPQRLFDLLNEEFEFELDVCAQDWSAKCERYYTPADDGLAQPWYGRCFMNPPYGRTIDQWVSKAYESAKAGAVVVCLVPARVDTAWWWDYCRWGEVRFLRGRLHFDDGEDAAPFPSCAVVMGEQYGPSVVWWEAWQP
jgi:phage N-6-adenine-methyltransferase